MFAPEAAATRGVSKRRYDEVKQGEDELIDSCTSLLTQCSEAIDEQAAHLCRPEKRRRWRGGEGHAAELDPTEHHPSFGGGPADEADGAMHAGGMGDGSATPHCGASGDVHHADESGMDEDGAGGGGGGFAGEGDGGMRWAAPAPAWGRGGSSSGGGGGGMADSMMEGECVMETNPLALANPNHLELSNSLVRMLQKLGLQWYSQADGSLLANGGLEVSNAALSRLRAKVDADGVIRIHSTNDSGDAMIVEGRLTETTTRPFGRSSCRVDIRIKLLPQWPRRTSSLAAPPVLLGLPGPRSSTRTCYVTELPPPRVPRAGMGGMGLREEVDSVDTAPLPAGWRPKRTAAHFDDADDVDVDDGGYAASLMERPVERRAKRDRGLEQSVAHPGHTSRFSSLPSMAPQQPAVPGAEERRSRFRPGGSFGGPTMRDDGLGGKRCRMVVDS
jgi:hypothetical protein